MHCFGYPALEGNAQSAGPMETAQRCVQALSIIKHLTLLPGGWHKRHLQKYWLAAVYNNLHVVVYCS